MRIQDQPESTEAVPKVPGVQPTVVSKPFPAPAGPFPLTHISGIPHVNWRHYFQHSLPISHKLPRVVLDEAVWRACPARIVKFFFVGVDGK